MSSCTPNNRTPSKRSNSYTPHCTSYSILKVPTLRRACILDLYLTAKLIVENNKHAVSYVVKLLTAHLSEQCRVGSTISNRARHSRVSSEALEGYFDQARKLCSPVSIHS